MHYVRPKRWTEKPEGAVCVNFGHPLSLGLSSVLVFNNAASGGAGTPQPVVFDILWNQFRETRHGGSSWVKNAAGWAYYHTNNGATNSFIDLSPDNAGNASEILTTNRITILIIRRKTDNVARAATLFGTSDGVNGNRCGAHVPFSDGNVYWDFGGVAAPNRLTIAGETWNDQVDMFAFRAGGAGSAVWRNGVRIGNQTTAVTRGNPTTAGFSLYSGNGIATCSDDVEINFFAVAAQEWTDDMIAWWMTEPYAMLTPQAPTLRYFIPGPDALAPRRPIIFVTG